MSFAAAIEPEQKRSKISENLRQDKSNCSTDDFENASSKRFSKVVTLKTDDSKHIHDSFCDKLQKAHIEEIGNALNVRRKGKRRTLCSFKEKNDPMKGNVKSIKEPFSLTSDKEDNGDEIKKGCLPRMVSSQDSFTDLFASPITPKITEQSYERNDLLQNPESDIARFSGFFDEDDDVTLANLDLSDIISSHHDNESKEDHVNNIKFHGKDCCIMEKRVTADSTLQNLNEQGVDMFYGLPQQVGNLIKKHKGIEKLYDWQDDCLCLPALKNRKNLIYSLPTSGGKTLVAEILIMKELLLHNKDALLVLPYVSIVQEKVRDLSLFAVDLEFLVEEYAASKGKFPPRKRRKKKSLYVATIEKANGLVNSLIEENRISELGLIVVDELHMIGEGGHRGATLEMCLTKVLFCSCTTQIVGMSATLSNISDLQKFLNAEKYINDFRPVELKEYIKIKDEIYEVKNDIIGRNEEIPLKRSRKVKHKATDKKILFNDPDHLSVLVQEVIPNYSCLLFCPTKQNCENVAKLLASSLSRELKKVKVKEKWDLIYSLKNVTDGMCDVLRRVIPYGIAYHHGGLTMDERKLIEEAYARGTLCVLTCTSTLAAGVNLPAKRVILRSPYVGWNVMTRSQYKQMIGRAGRAGIDTSGESIMLVEEKDKNKGLQLINAALDSCYSSLFHTDGKGLRSLVLSLIGLKICNSIESINLFITKTLFAVQNDDKKTLLEKVEENIENLINIKLIKKKEVVENNKMALNVEATPLGRATFKGCVDVDRSPFIYDEIKRAQENLVLTNDLHLLYLVTTPDMFNDIQPDWLTYLTQVSKLNSVEQKASEFIGITEGYLSRQVLYNGRRKSEHEASVVKRFYLTLMLYKIINEHSIWEVAKKFGQSRGFIQSLFTSSTSFASCLVHFTNELPEFHNIMLLLQTIVDKLSYTTILELVPLMQIPGVKKNRAKQLYTAGYHNLRTVANANPQNLMKEIEHLHKTQANLLVSAAKMILLEKAEALQDEAAELIGTT
ncbi:helicase POLQ-like [Xenia sp. Carnegie-2017]|uniref:helicase POLQ-like n=1 Tax=Xenia sp. Carnegie-2017 TaxID=2897299 RepID=UPI001F0468A2|nr:helicase POLQ-like [Xenia sp. Carnegie-2017]